MTLELLAATLLALQAPAGSTVALPLNPGDRIIVTDTRGSIQGRIAEITRGSLVVDKQNNDGLQVTVPLAGVQQIDRLGDSVANGAAIGAALGGVSAITAMALSCSNTNCADTSANIDPRLTLLGTLAGAGVGALIDAAIDGRTMVYRAGASQAPSAPDTLRDGRMPTTAFVRFGWAGLSDDEGSLGSGAAVGGGIMVPIGRRAGVQVAYDRHDHRRHFESGAPPGIAVPTGGFTGTEQLVTAKGLLFFRTGKALRPYAGIGLGLLDSTRRSEFPTYVTSPGGIIVPGAPERYDYDTREFALGFSAGFYARVARRFSILTDLSLDLSNPGALSSARIMAGAGWHF